MAKVLSKFLANRIQHHMKNIICNDPICFIPGMQGFLTLYKSISVIHHIKKLKDESNMIISIETEKASDKIQPLFITKTLQKAGIEGKCLNILKAINNKPRTNIILNSEKLKAFPLKSKQDKGAHAHHYYSTQFWKS